MSKINVLLSQIDDAIAQDNTSENEKVDFTPGQLTDIIDELKHSLEQSPQPKDKEHKKQSRERKKQIKEVETQRDKLSEYDGRREQIGDRNSMSKTDPDATPVAPTHYGDIAITPQQQQDYIRGWTIHVGDVYISFNP